MISMPPSSRRPKVYARHLAIPLAAAALLIAGLFANAPAAQAEPPAPPSAETIRGYLAELTTEPEGSSDGYDRDLFPHWSDQEGACNTREVVLERDGTDIQQDEDCYPVSGSWFSVYDGATWTDASDVDIDHVVPLAEAWRSGAAGWTTDEREGFANDLETAQLIAVTDDVNQAKGDQDPAEWMPQETGYHCTYARMWVWVKHTYDMTVDDAEKSALEDVLGGC